jgi:hypothetical protein
MLVESSSLFKAGRELARQGTADGLSGLAGREPVLAAFLSERLAAIAGKLALSGAPSEVVQGSYEETLGLVLTCVQALRHGHYELWIDTMTGTRLAQLDPSLQPKPRRRRKKDQTNGTDQEEA